MRKGDWLDFAILYLAALIVVALVFIGMYLMLLSVSKKEEPIKEEMKIPVTEMVEHYKKPEVKTVVLKKEQEEEKPHHRISVTDSEIKMMARVVMSEASLLNFDAKEAVACVIINRVLSDEYPNTVKEVIEEPYQFCTADNGEPDFDCYLAVECALMDEAFPPDMLWFRSGKAHEWGYVYAHIGNTYFTTEGDYNNGFY
jgi:hypothetical protein